MPDFTLQRVNGRFHAVWYDEGGRRHRRSLGTDRLEQARPAFTEFKRAFTLASQGAPAEIADIFAAYLADREEEKKPAAPRIRDAWKRLSPVFGPLLPAQVTAGLCKDYISEREGAGASPGTIHVELGYLRAALRFARVKRGWIAAEPYVPMPRKPEPRDHHLTRDEARALIAAASMPHVKLFIILALATAGRSGALLGLTWSRIDFARRRIHLRDPQRPATLKGRAVTPMNAMAFEALMEAQGAALTPFVIEWGGKGVASVKKAVASAARRAGLSCSPHVLRHTAAVWMAEAGVPMEEIASYLGHSTMDTTRRVYARFSPDYLRAAARALDL